MDITNRVLLEACAQFERAIARLFANAPLFPGSRSLVEIPIIGGPARAEFVRSNPSFFLPQICAALIAREHFRQDYPGWPILPLRDEDCEELKNADCPRQNLVGYYGDSLGRSHWDLDKHPSFRDFGCGLMACAYAPEPILNDPDLQNEFPPHPLTGLCDGLLVWRDAKKVAWDRESKALAAAGLI
jgi:hypothetical protein